MDLFVGNGMYYHDGLSGSSLRALVALLACRRNISWSVPQGINMKTLRRPGSKDRRRDIPCLKGFLFFSRPF